MSTVGRGGGGAAVDIPASTKKVVQDLKEVVGNSEEEIYAMLKECNMDPNETAQRLLNQGDPFHEVKRKRDKKKDSGGSKEGADVRGRPGSGGNYGRGGGRGGGGRGSSLPRFGSQEHGGGGGRGRGYGRDNGVHPSSRGSGAVPSSGPAHGQAKPATAAPASSAAAPAAAPAAAAPQAQPSSAGSGGFPGVANGSSGYVRPAPAPQGAWASGHTTMADILKAQVAPAPSFQAPSATLPSPGFPGAQASVSASYPEAAPSAESSDASEFYSSSADPVLHSSVDSRGGSAQGAIGTVGNQRPIGDRPVSTSSAEMSLGTSAAAAQPVSSEPSSVPATAAAESRDAEAQVEVAAAARPASPVSVISPVSSEDLSAEEAGASADGGSAQAQQAGGRSVLGGSQYNGQPLYAPPLQPVGTQKGGVGLEWKAKGSGQSSVGASSDGGSQSLGAVDPTMIVQSYQALSLQDDEPVIIPTHFRVPEADRSHLSFGSFGSDFSTGFGTSFGLEEVEKTKHVEPIVAEEAPVEQAAPASVETQVEMVQSYGHQQQGATSVENMSAGVEAASVVHQGPAVAAQEQHLKPDPVVQQSPAYFLGASNYPGFGLMPQMPGGQYGYEQQAESQAQDVSRIPSMVAYDPTTSYYTSAFRGADADRLYPPYAPTNTSSKYSGNIGLMTAPSLPSSQEGVNPMMVSAGPSVAPSSQAGSNVQSAQAIPQQALPMHYSQPPSGHYGNFVGYQYVPQNYPFLQPPYPHHMYNSSNSAYAQLPAGSSYPPTAGSSYPSGGATAVKFPMPQYKPVAGAGNAPQSAPGIGYGGYTTTPSGYASNPAVTAGNASGYEDVNPSHYKDSTLYIPNQQQGDSSTVWIQTSMPRDMGPSGAMQTSSYYNLASQGQHSGYAQHSQQPTHGHAHPNAAYANLYHPSQAGPAASHQMLQQPQGMGGGAGNTQAGAYQQQPQRTQQTWNNSNY
ncbi:hypothetical protein M758_10G069800 [Ceratodon purpureus]|uniref:GBF-interacting protein 1 N-terminal domain-containing protein n=1 Tax=Ceratodon purpureus TaxID=3225 RepID=A0A8T0GMN8_CERPU|nr:hypothetical protein KC19_10G072100 [Ceratodon purpureus]KAG0603145.1 hypothetical protein M758_10G069800 [Ceratodon purpureus]